MECNVLVKIATRGRGLDLLKPWFDNRVLANTFILISVDLDDESVNHKPEWLREVPSGTYLLSAGNSQSKIHAMNRDIDHIPKWNYLILGSDDMTPLIKGYDRFVSENCKVDRCLWLPTEDSTPHRRGGHRMIPGTQAYLDNWICMLPIMGRKYYDHFGYVYHPSYKGFWCDNEQTQVAQKLNRLDFINNPNIFKHNHPDWGGTQPRDETYARYNIAVYQQDRLNFKKRKAQNFYL